MAWQITASASSALFSVGREAAFVADGGGEAAVVQDFLERVEDFGAVAERFAEGGRADRA